MNSWPGGKRHAMYQSEHDAWNKTHYPGTRQLCFYCGMPTERCEDDTLWVDDEPACVECWEEQENES